MHLVHISDLHWRTNWDEDEGVLLNEFFKDLSGQLNGIPKSEVLLVFTGDLVKAGGDASLYQSLRERFHAGLQGIGLGKENILCVPGNHDMDIKETKKINHKSIIAHDFDEKSFNDYLGSDECFLHKKFETYRNFQSEFSNYYISDDGFSGSGHKISESVDIFCINSAIFCGEGSAVDKGRLRINTRTLNSWNNSSKAQTKIVVMHHPVDWLHETCRRELTKIMQKDISIFLHGHSHDQEYKNLTSSRGAVCISCSSPPLLTDKHGELGYAILSLSEVKGLEKVTYRQWTRHNSFVPGVNFSNTENGSITISVNRGEAEGFDAREKDLIRQSILRIVESRYEHALELYPGQPVVWVEPVLRKASEKHSALGSLEDSEVMCIDDILSGEARVNINIVGHAQFGLTSLAHHICKRKLTNENQIWIYVDVGGQGPSKVESAIKRELKLLGIRPGDLHGVVIDGWSRSEKYSMKIIESIESILHGKTIVIMESSSDTAQISSESLLINDKDYTTYHLSSLTRNRIRDLVVQYFKGSPIYDTDAILRKLISDLAVLNLHRTPLNCLTLLKVAEVDFEESPVNRTEVIRRVLFLLFNIDELPGYKIKPDLKDCEHILGWFCEKIIRENNLLFKKEDFVASLRLFCEDNIVEIDIIRLFDILYSNNILIKKDEEYRFKYTYWIMYFAAHRMHHDEVFRRYIFEGMRYASYPELIEFYTGIDRRRNDALEILIKDLSATYDIVADKTGFPAAMNPYDLAKWSPSPEAVLEMQQDFERNVHASKLPSEIKDHISDLRYDPSRPYNQDIQVIVKEYLVDLLMKSIQASSRALRNSDYASPDMRKKLLKLIFDCWILITRIILVISPILANKGRATFEGSDFVLHGDFGSSDQERFETILKSIPDNIMFWQKEDIISQKMGPLFFDQLSEASDSLLKHYLVRTIIIQKPHGWKEKIRSYIVQIHKNSFYLYDVQRALNRELSQEFCSPREEKDVEDLLKSAWAKHEIGAKNPSKKLMAKLKLNRKSRGQE